MKIVHRGLRQLYEYGNARRLNPLLIPRIQRVLTALDEATEPRHMDIPGLDLHPLKGQRTGQWSVRVSGNWRIVFRFDNSQAVGVDLIDYH